MDRTRALALLGLSELDAKDGDVLRRAYRSRMREVHPDVNTEEGAAELTVLISRAYELLVGPAPPPTPTAGGDAASTNEPRGSAHTSSSAGPDRVRPLVTEVLDESSILVREDRETTFRALLEAAHTLGEIGYLDRSAWLVEVLVEFLEAPTSSVVMTLQGRASGTEVICTVEPLSGGQSPPISAVTGLIARALVDVGLPTTRRGG